MIIVPVKEGDSIDKAIKKLKRKFEKVGLVREIRERQFYTKPSERRRQIIARAKYLQRLKEQSDKKIK